MTSNEFVRRDRTLVSVALFASLLVLSSGAPAAAARSSRALTVRADQAIGAAGGAAVIVLTTYASRPLGQGQICFRARPRLAANRLRSARARASSVSGPGPFAALEDTQVFSAAGDAVSSTTFEDTAEGQRILVQFISRSASVNALEGPLAAVRFQLRDLLVPDEAFEIVIDPAETFLFDDQGRLVTVKPRDGVLKVRAPGAPFRVEMEGAKIHPGEIADLSLKTFEPFAVGAGQVGFVFDPSIAAGPPVITLDSRHGASVFTVETPAAGLVIVAFQSQDASLNLVPGELIAFDLPTLPSTPVGTRSPVSFDPALTFFLGPDGDLLQLDLRSDLVVFR